MLLPCDEAGLNGDGRYDWHIMVGLASAGWLIARLLPYHKNKILEYLMHINPSKQVLHFFGIEFTSRSFMVQLYSMLAKECSQARFINMNKTVQQMYSLAVRAYYTPSAQHAILTELTSKPQVYSIA